MSRSRRQKRIPSGPNWARCIVAGIGIGLGVFLISVVFVVFGFLSYARNFLQSERFHGMVEDKLSAGLKADVELGVVRWEGTSAFADRVSGPGREDAGFAKFALAGLRADLDLSLAQFKRRVWKVTGLTISQLDVLFAAGGRVPAKPAPTPERKPEPGPARRTLIGDLIPRQLELDEMKVNTLNLYWESGEDRLSATGMHAVAQPATGEAASYAIKVRGGTIQGTQTAKLEIDALDLNWKGRSLFVTEAKLRNEGGALIALDGDILLGAEGKPGSMQLDATVTQLPAGRLGSESGPARVKGDLEIGARITGDPGAAKDSRQEGRITLRNGVVETLPILQMLARFTGSKRFERIALRDGGGAKFVREKGRTVFSEIDFQSDGLARLTGDLVIQDGNLDGLLQLGVIPGTLSWIPEVEQTIFKDSHDGHLWTPVRISGTVEHPQNDLTPRLAAAGVEAATSGMEAAANVLGRMLEGGAKDTTGAPGEKPAGATEPVGKAVDFGRELLKGFLK